jgi:hypothetical protein
MRIAGRSSRESECASSDSQRGGRGPPRPLFAWLIGSRCVLQPEIGDLLGHTTPNAVVDMLDPPGHFFPQMLSYAAYYFFAFAGFFAPRDAGGYLEA